MEEEIQQKEEIHQMEEEINQMEEEINQKEEEIKQKKEEINQKKEKIKNVEAETPVRDGNAAEKRALAIWEKEIHQLKVQIHQLNVQIHQLEVQIQELKVEIEILELMMEIEELKAEVEDFRSTQDYKDICARKLMKEASLVLIRETLNKIREKLREINQLVFFANPVKDLAAVALDNSKPHHERVIALINSTGAKNQNFPSDYSKCWNTFEFEIDEKSVVETHRPPAPNRPTGHRHVTLTSEALGKLYARFYASGSVKESDLLPEDYELAGEVSQVAVEYFREDASRMRSSRQFLRKLVPDGARSQPSFFYVDSFDKPQMDHTYAINVTALNHDIPVAIFEFKTEMGTNGDSIMEAIAYHFTHIIKEDILQKTHVPCLLITISGPVVVVYCGAWTGEVFHYDYLTSIVTHPSRYQPYFTTQALFWRNIKDGLQEVANEAKEIDRTLQPGFPYPRTFKEGDKSITFKYTAQIENKASIFKAVEQDGQERKLIVKFCPTYNVQVHGHLADQGLAPEIYGVEELVGGWVMVVMEEIEEAVTWKRETHGKEETLIGQLRQVLDIMGKQSHVHGDLRGPNVLVKGNDKLYIIDFEWAGVEGAARFSGVINKDIFGEVGGRAGGLITQEMDRKMVNYMLTGKYT